MLHRGIVLLLGHVAGVASWSCKLSRRFFSRRIVQMCTTEQSEQAWNGAGWSSQQSGASLYGSVPLVLI